MNYLLKLLQLLRPSGLIFLLLFLTLVQGLSIRGKPGNPRIDDLNTKEWKELGPFELSPERGRFALTYSLVEDHSFSFSPTLAQFAMPDLGILGDKFVSLFAPGLSLLALPGYLIGSVFNYSQIGSFSVISIFGLANALLIRRTALKLKAAEPAANLASIIYLLATPAFAYSVSFYQHQTITFLLLAAYNSLLTPSAFSAGLVFLLSGIAFIVDYPSIVLMLPALFLSLVILFGATPTFKKLLQPLFILLPLLLLSWFNLKSYQDPFRLAGTLPRPQVEVNSKTQLTLINPDTLTLEGGEKSIPGFFHTRNLLNGFYVHLLSPDRGLIFYSPVILLGLLGLITAFKNKKNHHIYQALIATITLNLLLYSMWADPWGGWAFGSRYLIPSYALLAVFLAILLSRTTSKILVLTLFYILAIYSVIVNTFGALTSSRIPTKPEINFLESQTNMPQDYTYRRYLPMLEANTLKSFVFTVFATNFVTARQYYLLLVSAIIFYISLLFIQLLRYHQKTKNTYV
ncbi:hypothetical protein HY333_01830 [Candidatus Collierbacteria bacterium]|nr:hypothetical protein [Candidatus Collierbacteria bacterium]